MKFFNYRVNSQLNSQMQYKIIHILIFSISLLLNPIQIYSQIYINEINFIDDEYIEIYSNSILNLTNNKIFDENTDTQFNTLSLNKIIKDSKYYLIIGNNFAQNNDLSNFNCTIYQSDKSQVSNGGLKSTAENLKIQIDNSTNLTYTNLKDYNFNETLNYNLTNNKYYISNQTPCKSNLNDLYLNENIDEIINESDQNQSNSTNDNNSDTNYCNFNFEIETEKDIFEDKIEYNFNTNASDFEIDYWIETYDNEIAKSKLTTSNTNKKSYTPDKKTQIYNLKGILKKENCTLETSKYISFYSNLENTNEKETEVDLEKQTTITISNENDLINLKTNELKYEIYRGDTSKRTTYFYLNSKIIHTNEINKYSKSKGKIFLDLQNGKNNLIIQGLDIEKEIIIFNNKNDKENINIEITNNENLLSNLISSTKQYFLISNLEIENNTIHFEINSNLENLTANCYINLLKTLISNEINVSNTSNKLKLEIENNILSEKSKENTNNLKLTCKYKKSHLKTFNYESLEFNYTINSNKLNNQLNNELELEDISNNYNDQKEIFENYSYSNTNFLSELEEEQLYENQLYQENLIKNETSYFENNSFESKNTKNKMNSIYFVFIGTIFLLTALLIKW